MSNNLYNSKSFANTSGLTVDTITTTSINNIVYNTNVNDISGYITGLYQSVGNHNILFDSISGKFNSLTGITNSDKFNFTRYNGTSSFGSYMAVEPTLRHLEIVGSYYLNGDDIFRKVKIKDYVEITNLSINNPLNATTNYKFYCNGNAYFNGYLDISGNINHKSNLTTNNISCGNITSTGLITNSIISSGTNGPLIIDVNYSTNNHVQINDRLIVNGDILMGGFLSLTYLGNTGYFSMTDYGYLQIGMPSTGNRFNINCNCGAISYITTSDDRLKTNEVVISNATETILKLRPETYDKYGNFDLSGLNFIRESGLIAQEVYNIPELRHLVGIPPDASGNLITTQSSNVNDDPNYNPNWGTTPASLNYNGLIAYLVKSIQELDARIKVLEG